VNINKFRDISKKWDPMGHKDQMIKWLVKKLLYPDREFIRKQIDELVDNNNLIVGIPFPGFAYEDDYFEKGGKILTNFGWDPVLDDRLRPKAVGVADRWRRLEKDVEHIDQVFRQLTERCQTWQEFRDALPDCVIQFEDNLRSIPRTRHESYFQGKPTTRFSYEMLLPRLHTYAAMHLLT
jgi:hypothetical protein